MVTTTSPYGMSDTMDRLAAVLTARAIKHFATFDHAAEARAVGLDLRETRVVVFGNPLAGTPVMQAVPAAALDLPLKVVVWEQDDGEVRIGYTPPEELGERHGLGPELSSRLDGVRAVVDAVVAR